MKPEVSAKPIEQSELELKIAQFEDGIESTESFWNLITLGFGTTVFLIYLIPPFSEALQSAWRSAAKTGEVVQQIVTGVDKTANYWAPNLKRSPIKGEKIAGYAVTSPYGPRKAPVPGASTFHQGTDIATPEGTQVYAIGDSAEMVEVKCWWDKGGGGNIATYYSQGWKFEYLHLAKCQPGKHKAGSVVALTGNTGLDGGPHLHFQMSDAKGNKIPPYTGYIFWALTGEQPKPLIAR